MAKPSISSQLEQLGLSRDQYRVAGLLPLVYVAWADGSIARAERGQILRVGKERGWITEGTEEIVDGWLTTPPDAEVGLSLVTNLLPRQRGLGSALTMDADMLVSCCLDVAAAAGGGLAGDPVSSEETDALRQIASALGIDATRWREIAEAATPANEPPGPLGYAQLKAMFGLLYDPAATLLEQLEQHGEVFRLRAGVMRLVMVATPEGAQRVLVDNADNYLRGTVVEPLRKVGGKNVATEDGDVWRRLRRSAQPAFRERFYERMLPTVVRIAEETVARWDGITDVEEQMRHATLLMVGHLSAGADLGEPGISESLATIVDYSSPAHLALSLPLFVPVPSNVRFVAARDRFKALLDDLIAERRQAKRTYDDLLAVLMQQSGDPLTDEELRQEMLGYVIAGYETTASALTWTMQLLGTVGGARRAVEEEVRAATPDGITLESLDRMPYTERVLREAMRLYAPAPAILREATSEDMLGGCRIPAGSITIVSPWLIHRNPRAWPDPSRFDPDRFTEERMARTHRFAHLPFGAGGHKCIGMPMALMEMKVMVAAVARAGELVSTSEETPRALLGVSMRPEGGLPMVLTRW